MKNRMRKLRGILQLSFHYIEICTAAAVVQRVRKKSQQAIEGQYE
jgi:hypothetical protein